MRKFLPLLFLLAASSVFGQNYKLTGRIYDAKTNKPLDFVTVKEESQNRTAVSSSGGEYSLTLNAGTHRLVFSYIGYFSDTLEVLMENSNREENIYLTPSEIITEGIEVFGEDPAYEIVRRAIRYKAEFKKKLKEYEYDAYSKIVIRSSQGAVTTAKTDSAGNEKLGILGVLESETKGYFRAPEDEKQIILSKKETANIGRGFAVPIVLNFYDEEVDLNRVKIPTPLADDAFDHYEYKLRGTTSIDSTVIYKIDVISTSNNLPQFYGNIYIADSSFALMRADLSLNEAAKIRGFDQGKYVQKFSQYTDVKGEKFWMPSDIQFTGEGTFVGFVKVQIEGFAVITQYDLNEKAPAGTFDEYIVKVLPDAAKDEKYWQEKRLVRTTDEEQEAYKKATESETARRNVSFNVFSINIGKYLSSSPLSYFKFNRVEGTHLELNMDYAGKLRKTTGTGFIGYGLQDKKLKYELRGTQRLLPGNRLTLSAGIYKRLDVLSFDQFGLADFYNTVSSLFFKDDIYDYYYSSGFFGSAGFGITDNLRTNLRYREEKQTTAFRNTDYSITNKSKSYRDNPPINDGFQRTIGGSLQIDVNTYRKIDWGDGDESRFSITNYPRLDVSYDYSGRSLGSGFEYRRYGAALTGRHFINGFLNVRYRLGGTLINGEVPFQSLAYFNSATDGLNSPLGFKTMRYQEYLGDKIFYLNFENNFRKSLWGNIPVLKRFDLIGFVNLGRADITSGNLAFSSYKGFNVTDGIYSEAGFGIAGILDLFRMDFAWRLNNFCEGRNFNFSISLDNF